MTNLILESSYAKRSFKKRIGNANHLLITILVGLDEIESGNVVKSPSFSTSWNPKNPVVSAKRSSRFALNSALSWAIDNLDAYFIISHQKPTIIEGEDLSNAISGAGQSVSLKLDTFNRFLSRANKPDEDKYAAMVALGIQWRNNTTHFDAANKLEKPYISVLKDKRNKQWFMDTFQSLDIAESLKRFNKGESPSFKEVTAIIRAIHVFVSMLDDYLLSSVDVERLAKEIIQKHYSNKKTRKGHVLAYGIERKVSLVKMILQSNGFSETNEKYNNRIFVLNGENAEECLRQAIVKPK